MSVLNFPNKRLEYAGAGIDNPMFVSDVVNATESVLAAMKSLLGLGDTDFAIISGFTFSGSAYSAGIIYLNGIFYLTTAPLAVNKYLIPNVTNEHLKIFSDSNTRYIYSIYYAATSNTPVTGSTPQFKGDMNQYRMNLNQCARPHILDSNGFNFTIADFTKDDSGDWHGLDFNSIISTSLPNIVPANAKMVLLSFEMVSSAAGTEVFFAYGDEGTSNQTLLITQVSGVKVFGEAWFSPSISYNIPIAVSALNVVVKAWM